MEFFDFGEAPRYPEPVETGVGDEMEIMLVIESCVGKAGLILVEKTEFAVGKRIVWIASN